MKYLLEEDYEFDFNLLGICCHEKDYRLCWAINSTLNLNLSKASEDIELIFNKESKPDANFSIYSYTSKYNSDEYYLISNKCQRTWLIPEKSHFDFFVVRWIRGDWVDEGAAGWRGGGLYRAARGSFRRPIHERSA